MILLSIKSVMIIGIVSRIVTASSTTFCTKNSVTKVINSSIMGDCKQHSEENLRALAKKLVPPLSQEKHKGQAGRIAVFGGSIEYTGAPYFAAITALKVGADLSHVFCTKDAAPVIKSYSPELIVHPLLTVENPIAEIEPWLERFHTIVIGPGLGRDPKILNVIGEVIKLCNRDKKPLVIDADGLFYVTQKPEILGNYSASVILTPNKMEFSRLTGTPVDSTASNEERAAKILTQSPNLNILLKGQNDVIFNRNEKIILTGGGSGRRCGGQGDLISGALATFLCWSQINDDKLDVDKVLLAAWASSRFVRLCNEKAFKEHGRSMTASDMIEKIHDVFEETFEN